HRELFHNVPGCVSQIAAPGRRSHLIIHYSQFWPFRCQLENGLQEIFAARAVDPRGPEYQIISSHILHGTLSAQLADAIHVERSWRICLFVRRSALSIENIVSGVRDK